MSQRTIAILIHLLVYTISILLSFLSLKYLFRTESVLHNVFYADLVGSIVVFTACVVFNNISIYDPYWTIQASCISFYYFYKWSESIYDRNMEQYDLRNIAVFILVNTWSIRLTSNLFINSVTDIKHEDWRYSDYRVKIQHKVLFYMVRLFTTYLGISVSNYNIH